MIKTILDHLNEKEAFAAQGLLPESRAPPLWTVENPMHWLKHWP